MTALLGMDMIGLFARYSPSRPRFLLLPNGCPADAARYSMSAYISATCSTNNCALRCPRNSLTSSLYASCTCAASAGQSSSMVLKAMASNIWLCPGAFTTSLRWRSPTVRRCTISKRPSNNGSGNACPPGPARACVPRPDAETSIGRDQLLRFAARDLELGTDPGAAAPGADAREALTHQNAVVVIERHRTAQS